MEKSWRVSDLTKISKMKKLIFALSRSLKFSCDISSEQQRAQKVFKAQTPLDLPAARNKLLGFGMQLLDSIDPNPDNMVCAGIIHTQGQQVGCLLRLEPNRQAQVCYSFYFIEVLIALN